MHLQQSATATEMLWSQKYRPATISEAILPENTKKIFQKFVDDRNVPNLMLCGPPGTGKTTAALAMLNQLHCDYILINGSMNGGIDTLRHEIANFASTVSFAGGRKYVIIDEADYLTANTQAALRSFSEEFSKNCGFIFTCNFKHRILPALHSRFAVIDFSFDRTEKPKAAMRFFKRVIGILETEGVAHDQKTVAKVIERHFPDFRRVLNELQRYAATGAIDIGVLSASGDGAIQEVFGYIQQKNFTETRKWVATNSDQDVAEIYRKLYDIGVSVVPMTSIPTLVVVLARYQYQHAFVADHELNLIACLTELMAELEW
jgi:DNA polymerase III delta prime subunit